MKIAQLTHHVVPSPEGPGAGSASTLPREDAIFIPLCGLRQAIVIQSAARNLRAYALLELRSLDSSSLRSSE